MAVGRAAREDIGEDAALRVGLEAQVDEARTRDLGARDAVLARQLLGQPRGEVARRDPGLLGRAERDVGRVVAVLGVARPLDADVLGQRRAVQASSRQHR